MNIFKKSSFGLPENNVDFIYTEEPEDCKEMDFSLYKQFWSRFCKFELDRLQEGFKTGRWK